MTQEDLLIFEFTNKSSLLAEIDNFGKIKSKAHNKN